MDKQLLFYKDFEFYPSTFSTLQDVPMWTLDSQKQSIWYKNIVSELLTKVPLFAISVRRFYFMNSVRRFYFMNSEWKCVKTHVFWKTVFLVTLSNSWFQDKKFKKKYFWVGPVGSQKRQKSPKWGNLSKNRDFNEVSGNFHIIKVHEIVQIFISIAGALMKVLKKLFLLQVFGTTFVYW